MLKVRIIPCLDVKEGRVVKGVQFKDQIDVGDILDLARRYSDEGADELVFYDISASAESRTLDRTWIERIASVIQIPFCVAGGIRSIRDGEEVLAAGADKISVNSPALENPDLINQLTKRFGSQCVVVSIDSYERNGVYYVYQYTGDPTKSRNTLRRTEEWAKEARDRGAGEIVLNCMNQDGMKKGYDLRQLSMILDDLNMPAIASGGAGSLDDFYDVFKHTKVTGALAASVFHRGTVGLKELKENLKSRDIEVRL